MQESIAMKVASQNKIDQMINSILGVYIEENLKQEGLLTSPSHT